MTQAQDEIIEMARQASAGNDDRNVFFDFVIEELEAFAKLVRNDYSNKHAQLWLKRIDEAVKAEREAVLDLVNAYAKNNTDLADAIRARNTD